MISQLFDNSRRLSNATLGLLDIGMHGTKQCNVHIQTMFVSSCQNVIAKIENLNQDTSDRVLSILIGVRGEGGIFVGKAE
jgi:hypothetical protein